MTFPEKLQKARQKKLLTQAELAEKVGVTARSIQNYEMGARYPKRHILAKICKALDIRAESLIGRNDFYEINESEDWENVIENAQKLLDLAEKLFESTEVSEADKDKVMLALQSKYWKAKEKKLNLELY